MLEFIREIISAYCEFEQNYCNKNCVEKSFNKVTRNYCNSVVLYKLILFLIYEMHFKNLITLTASFFLFGSVSGDLCSKSMELRKIRKNQTINWSERQNDYNKYDTDVLAEVSF